jgi:hypothetical protein
MVVGDSVGHRLAAGMLAVAPKNVTIIDGGRLSCPLGRDATLHIFGHDELKPECAQWPQAWGLAVAAHRPDVIVGITGPWDRASSRIPGTTDFTDVTDPAHRAWLAGEYRAALAVLTHGGARAFWTQTPCVDPIWPGPDPFSQPARRVAVDGMLGQLQSQGLLTVVPLPAYRCHGGVDMFDGIHWNDPVAARIGAQVLDEVLARLGTPAPSTH